MFYLAEVVQKGKTFLGKSRIVLQLLACQQRDGWRSLANAEQIALEGYEYNPGVLLLVELAPTRDHALKLEEAQRALLGMLQDHGRLQEQVKIKEAEVEQWRESLRIQSEEVSRRQTELEIQQDELSDLKAELDELAHQHHDVRVLRDELQQVRQDLEQKNQELSAAWQQIQAGLSEGRGTALQPAQAQAISDTLNVLLSQERSDSSSYVVLDRLKGLNLQQQLCLERCQDQIQRLASGTSTEAGGTEVLHQHQQAEAVQRQLTLLEQQQAAQASLRLQVQQLMRAEAEDFDLATLERLPLEQLEERVQTLEKEAKRILTFVNDQEEELRLQREAIEQLKTRLASSDEFARLALEGELSDAEDRYRMLDNSLVEQRRTSQQRWQTYRCSRQVLDRRQGLSTPDDLGLQVDFTPLLRLLDERDEGLNRQRQQLQQELGRLQVNLPLLEPDENADQPHLVTQILEESRNLQCLLSETADLFTELNRQWDLRQQLCHQLQELLAQCVQRTVAAG